MMIILCIFHSVQRHFSWNYLGIYSRYTFLQFLCPETKLLGFQGNIILVWWSVSSEDALEADCFKKSPKLQSFLSSVSFSLALLVEIISFDQSCEHWTVDESPRKLAGDFSNKADPHLLAMGGGAGQDCFSVWGCSARRKSFTWTIWRASTAF